MQYQYDEIRQGSQEFGTLLKCAKDFIILTNSQGMILNAGTTAVQFLGLDPKELFAQPIESLIHPKDLSIFKNFQGGESNRCQARIINKDKKALWLLWSLTRIPKQNLIYFTAMDLTEVKEANQNISHSEAKLQRVLSDGHIGYWEVTFATGELVISDNIREWWGLTPDQKPDNDFYLSVLHPDDKPEIIKAQKLIIETRQPHETIHRTRKPDGSYIWIQGTGHPMLNEEGELIGLIGTSMDITQKVELEAALKLQQAKMMTSSRLSAIGEMASLMAHEINNPLAIIYLNSESLRQNHSNPDLIKARAEKISQTAMRISRIIKSLRTLSRDGHNDPLEPVSASRILDDTLEICTQRFINQEIEFRVYSLEEDLMILARPTQLSQVLLNLLNNAFDAVEKISEPWIEVSLKASDSFVEFIVRDSGAGIAPNLQERIFEPFYTSKDPTKGTGLGLSVSRSIISSHSGTLQINTEAENTEFVVRLPRYTKKSLDRAQTQMSFAQSQPEQIL